MDRRTFFRRGAATTAGAALTLLANDEARGSVAVTPQEDLIRTAVTLRAVVDIGWREVDFKQEALDERNTHVIEMPPGFTPRGLSMNYRDAFFQIEIFDEHGSVMVIDGEAFAEGPLEFWRPIDGKMKVCIREMGSPSCPPMAVVTIFGTIPRR